MKESQDILTKLTKLTRRSGARERRAFSGTSRQVRREQTEGAASALETRYVTCDLRRATHRHTHSHTSILRIRIRRLSSNTNSQSRPLTIRPLCSEGVAERRIGRSKG